MLDLVLFILFTLGVTYGFTQASLLAPARMYLASKAHWLEDLLYCPFCISMWVGVASWYYFIGEPTVWIGGFVAVGAVAILPKSAWRSHEIEGELVQELRRLR